MSQRATTRSRGRIVHNANAPIHKLPVELLAEIFLTAYNESLKEEAESRLLSLITAVCGEWRSVALGVPRLWSVVIISTFPTGREFELVLQKAKAFLFRSKDASLRMVIGLQDGNSGRLPKKKFQRVFDIAQPHFHRCQELRFNLSTLQPYFDCFPLYGTLDRLEVLHIHASHWWTTPEGEKPTPIFSDQCTPTQLNSIIIMGMITIFPDKLSIAPIAHLHIDCNPNTWDSNLAFVSRCSTLTSLGVIMLDIGEDDVSSSLRISLPMLKSLSIMDNFAFGFASHISAPLLEELTIIQGYSPWARRSLPEDFSLPYPKLRTLVSICASFEDIARADLVRVFDALPALKRLEFDNGEINEEVAALLTRVASNPLVDSGVDSAEGSSGATTRTTIPNSVSIQARRTLSAHHTMQYFPALEHLVLKHPHRLLGFIPMAIVRTLLILRPALVFECDSQAVYDEGGDHLTALLRLEVEFGSRFKLVEDDSDSESDSDSDSEIGLDDL